MTSRLVIFAVMFTIAACSATPPSPPPAPAEPASSPPAPETPAVEPALPAQESRPLRAGTLTVAAVGDIMLGTDFPKNILPDDDGVGFLAEVTPILTSADIAFGNLEGVLLDGGEPVKECKDPSVCHLFRSPTRYAQHLAAAGFDVMSLANNHAHDFGEEGRSSGMQALESVGIHHSGREGDVASWEVGGLRVALIAFAPNIGAHALNDYARAAELVADLASRHDIVLVSFHGGAEGVDAATLPFAEETYHGEARGNVVTFAHAVIDAGADLVLGHGPHVARALEYYNERLIAYSLGNFATYYGISVEGSKGVAPILVAELDASGRLLRGRIESMIQVRPGGPRPDPALGALRALRALTEQSFGAGELLFAADGSFTPP
ncbi:MAG TPA: CapA family protein [Steroidobacteraceae bacterium]|nr:CapA family protein [Steroidobacteraceae bacterium]